MAKMKGGDKVRQILKDIRHKIEEPLTLRVGFLEKATYPDGKPVAMIAAIHNFGAPRAGIPPRPFFTHMINKHEDEWPEGFATQLRETDFDVRLTFERAGQAIAGQLRQSIVDTNEPPLAASTIARKGFDKPLVETGHMLNSVDSDVKTKT